MDTTNISSQPSVSSILVTGGLSTLAVLVLAFVVIAPFEQQFFMDWVATAFMAATPTQILIGLLWQNSKPDFVNGLSKPMKGLALTLITVIAGAVFLTAILFVVGGGHGVTPMLVQYTIMTVVVALWLFPIWQCWPFTLVSSDPFKFGLMTLLASYVIAYLVWSVFFDYAILEQLGHPAYFSDVDPHGLFDLWTALTFAVTSVGIIVVHVSFDFWPIERLSGGRGQPVRGLVGSVYVLLLAAALWYVFVNVLGFDMVDYMIRVPVCLIFGTFLVNNMMQFGLFAGTPQPLRGLLLLAITIVLAVLVYPLYAKVGALLTGHELASGPNGGFEREIWIASAMLGVTFPIVFIVSGYFGFWPLKR